jgi:hypothetical protein
LVLLAVCCLFVLQLALTSPSGISQGYLTAMKKITPTYKYPTPQLKSHHRSIVASPTMRSPQQQPLLIQEPFLIVG